ncbi:unnamed protein product [Ectocarpus sp. CCAP 1310/34]|nr:unnamed protein product [Ectocarpus sp. CCAP 1310/34]
MAAPPAANAPTDLSTCEPLDWATDNSKDLEWAWDRFLSRPSHSGEPWTRQQRVLLQNPALYYSNQSVREKGEMQEAQQWRHAAECMRTTAAPGTILFFRDVCNFRIPKGLNAAQLGRTSGRGERGFGTTLSYSSAV